MNLLGSRLILFGASSTGRPFGGGANGEHHMPASRKKNVTELAAERQRLFDEFNSKTVDDPAVDRPIWAKAMTIEAKIAKATFKTDADKLTGLKILFEEEPGIIVGEKYPTIFGEKFKLNLFLRMREFA
jgi:hypothetical protein